MKRENGCQVCAYISAEEVRHLDAKRESLKKEYGVEVSRSQLLRSIIQKNIAVDK